MVDRIYGLGSCGPLQLHPLFGLPIPATVDLQKQSSREMGRRGHTALLSLLLSLVLFYVFEHESIVRAVSIPAKFDGFVYNYTGTGIDSIIIEAFFDPVCPDSRDAWPPLKRAIAYYAPRVSLIVHPFALPWVILSLDLVSWEKRVFSVFSATKHGFPFLLASCGFGGVCAGFVVLRLLYRNIILTLSSFLRRIWEPISHFLEIHEFFLIISLNFSLIWLEKTSNNLLLPSVYINSILLQSNT